MGYSVVTTVLSRAIRHDLVCLETVKDELSIEATDTSDDRWLCRAIAQVSGSIATHTKRVFVPEVVKDLFDVEQDPYPYQTPGGFPQLQLSRWPVLDVAWVGQSLAPGTLQVLRPDRDYRVDPTTGRLLRLNPFTGAGDTWEAIPVTVIYTAGFGHLVREAGAVPVEAPLQVTASQTPFSCVVSMDYASGGRIDAVPVNPVKGQYSLVATAGGAPPVGLFNFNAADAGESLAIAYATFHVPPELEEICLRLITGRYSARDRDPDLIMRETPGVGTERWWFGGAPGQKGPFPPDIEGMLDDYRVPTVA
ncbi:MAG: hypothetical protein WA840_01005 [Caulobacteraceae bacterium]